MSRLEEPNHSVLRQRWTYFEVLNTTVSLLKVFLQRDSVTVIPQVTLLLQRGIIKHPGAD